MAYIKYMQYLWWGKTITLCFFKQVERELCSGYLTATAHSEFACAGHHRKANVISGVPDRPWLWRDVKASLLSKVGALHLAKG